MKTTRVLITAIMLICCISVFGQAKKSSANSTKAIAEKVQALKEQALEKQLKDIDKWLAGVRGRLANEKFVNSAPESVVADARKQLEELEARKTQTEAILAGLKA